VCSTTWCMIHCCVISVLCPSLFWGVCHVSVSYSLACPNYFHVRFSIVYSLSVSDSVLRPIFLFSDSTLCPKCTYVYIYVDVCHIRLISFMHVCSMHVLNTHTCCALCKWCAFTYVFMINLSIYSSGESREENKKNYKLLFNFWRIFYSVVHTLVTQCSSDFPGRPLHNSHCTLKYCNCASSY
jgi:hypothetical protein